MGTYCYVVVCRRGRLDGARRFGAHRERRGAGHIVAAARLQLVLVDTLVRNVDSRYPTCVYIYALPQFRECWQTIANAGELIP